MSRIQDGLVSTSILDINTDENLLQHACRRQLACRFRVSKSIRIYAARMGRAFGRETNDDTMV